MQHADRDLSQLQARTNGLLKQSMTRIAEVTDGLSQTIVVTEDAGRDARFVSAYSEDYYHAGPERDPPRSARPSPLLAMGRAR